MTIMHEKVSDSNVYMLDGSPDKHFTSKEMFEFFL